MQKDLSLVLNFMIFLCMDEIEQQTFYVILKALVAYLIKASLRVLHGYFVGDTNHQCSKQQLSPEKETCDYVQKACLVCGKNAGGESNHNPNND